MRIYVCCTHLHNRPQLSRCHPPLVRAGAPQRRRRAASAGRWRRGSRRAACVRVCARVCEREREQERGREREGGERDNEKEREREFVCICTRRARAVAEGQRKPVCVGGSVHLHSDERTHTPTTPSSPQAHPRLSLLAVQLVELGPKQSAPPLRNTRPKGRSLFFFVWWRRSWRGWQRWSRHHGRQGGAVGVVRGSGRARHAITAATGTHGTRAPVVSPPWCWCWLWWLWYRSCHHGCHCYHTLCRTRAPPHTAPTSNTPGLLLVAAVVASPSLPSLLAHPSSTSVISSASSCGSIGMHRVAIVGYACVHVCMCKCVCVCVQARACVSLLA